MSALFYRSALRLHDEEWAVYPSWSKGLAVFRDLVAKDMAAAMGCSYGWARKLIRQWEDKS